MKISFLIIITLFICLGAYAQVKKPVKKKAKKLVPAYVLHNNLDSTSYAYGVGLIKDLKARGLKTLNYAALNRAITDGLADKALFTPEQAKPIISAHFVTKFIANATASNVFMAANKSKPGVVTLPSGLQYTVLKDATGPKPTLTDTAYVNYVGTLADGKQFDASEAGKPFSTVPTAVIKGWTEGLQLMSVGSKYRFYVPFQLAYGDRAFDDGGYHYIFDAFQPFWIHVIPVIDEIAVKAEVIAHFDKTLGVGTIV